MIDRIQAILEDTWTEESYDRLRRLACDQNSKWTRYAKRILRNTDPNILKTFALNAGYEVSFRGYKTSVKTAEKYQYNIPWIILLDPTTACNLHCTGCWAAEHGERQRLTFEEMD